MFFDQMMNHPAMMGGAMNAGGNGMGSLANLIAARGGGMAPTMPQMGAVPQSGPSPGGMPAMPQQQQPNLLEMLLKMDPQRLKQMFAGIGMGGGALGGMPGQGMGGGPGPGTGGAY